MASSTLDPPLADYFWIAGIDSKSYAEHLARGGQESIRKSFTDQLLVAIEAEEDAHGSGAGGGGGGAGPSSSSLAVPNANTNGSSASSSSAASAAASISASSRRSNGAADRFSGHSESAFSLYSSESSPNSSTSTIRTSGLVRHSSNSSNSTITEANSGLTGRSSSNSNTAAAAAAAIAGGARPLTGRRDFDFDKALLKFAAERDSFLEDLSFSAGTVVPSKPLVHPRAHKVVADEPKLEKQNSLRRRISLRDLTSMRRSPSAVNRACKCCSMPRFVYILFPPTYPPASLVLHFIPLYLIPSSVYFYFLFLHSFPVEGSIC